MKKFKSILIIIFTVVFYNSSFAQIPVTDLEAGANLSAANLSLGAMNGTLNSVESNVSDMSGTVTQMERAISDMKKIQTDADNQSKSTQYMISLKSTLQFIHLIQTLICTYQNLSFLISASGNANFCFFQAHYQIGMVQLKYAIDLAALTFRQGVNQDQASRGNNLSKAIDMFRQANMTFGSLTTSLQGQTIKNNVNSYQASDIHVLSTGSRYSNGPRIR